MNVRKMIALAGFVTLTLAGAVAARPAEAVAEAVLVSPVVWAGLNNYLICTIINAGTKTITVTIEIANWNGTPLETETATISPGAIGHVTLVGGPGYCKFTGLFNKSLVRAAAHTYDPATSGSIVVVPAQ